MRRILTLALLALTLTGGAAMADRRGERGNVRDHRWNDRSTGTFVSRDRDRSRANDRRNDRDGDRDRDRDRWRYRDRSRYNYNRVVRVQRARPTFRDNRWYFSGGFQRTYSRPVINVRYTDYYQRPSLVAENYDNVPGYIWIAGAWQWTGYEWQWAAGHYEIDTSYQDNYYDGSTYYDYGY